jgi:hypothetical protein
VRRFADAVLGTVLSLSHVHPLTTALSLLTSRNASSNPLVATSFRAVTGVKRAFSDNWKRVRRT